MAIARSAHCVACFMRHSTQYDCESSTSASAASSGASASTSSTSASNGPRSRHDVEHLVGADRAADAPQVQLGAGLGVGVVAQDLERGLEVGDGQRELQVAAPAEAGPAMELGALFGRLRVRERRLEVAGGLTPLAACERVVARGAHGAPSPRDR